MDDVIRRSLAKGKPLDDTHPTVTPDRRLNVAATSTESLPNRGRLPTAWFTRGTW